MRCLNTQSMILIHNLSKKQKVMGIKERSRILALEAIYNKQDNELHSRWRLLSLC